MPSRGGAHVMLAVGVLAPLALATSIGTIRTEMVSVQSTGSAALPAPPRATPANFTVADDELVDSRRTGVTPAARAEGSSGCEACATHCRQRAHASARCDQEQCICRDLRNRGRCQTLGFGCGGLCEDDNATSTASPACQPQGRMNVVNNNNNNVVIMR